MRIGAADRRHREFLQKVSNVYQRQVEFLRDCYRVHPLIVKGDNRVPFASPSRAPSSTFTIKRLVVAPHFTLQSLDLLPPGCDHRLDGAGGETAVSHELDLVHLHVRWQLVPGLVDRWVDGAHLIHVLSFEQESVIVSLGISSREVRMPRCRSALGAKQTAYLYYR